MSPVPGLRISDVAQPALELRRDQVVGAEVEGGAQHAREARPPRPGYRAPLLDLTINLQQENQQSIVQLYYFVFVLLFVFRRL